MCRPDQGAPRSKRCGLARTVVTLTKFKGCARCGQREFVHRAVVPPILAPQKPASLG